MNRVQSRKLFSTARPHPKLAPYTPPALETIRLATFSGVVYELHDGTRFLQSTSFYTYATIDKHAPRKTIIVWYQDMKHEMLREIYESISRR